MINLFDWSSLIDQGKDLKYVLRVPNLETGKMEPLITGGDDGALTAQEEEQAKGDEHHKEHNLHSSNRHF